MLNKLSITLFYFWNLYQIYPLPSLSTVTTHFCYGRLQWLPVFSALKSVIHFPHVSQNMSISYWLLRNKPPQILMIVFTHDPVGWQHRVQLEQQVCVLWGVSWSCSHGCGLGWWIQDGITHTSGLSAGIAGMLGPLYPCALASFRTFLTTEPLQRACPEVQTSFHGGSMLQKSEKTK